MRFARLKNSNWPGVKVLRSAFWQNFSASSPRRIKPSSVLLAMYPLIRLLQFRDDLTTLLFFALAKLRLQPIYTMRRYGVAAVAMLASSCRSLPNERLVGGDVGTRLDDFLDDMLKMGINVSNNQRNYKEVGHTIGTCCLKEPYKKLLKERKMTFTRNS